MAVHLLFINANDLQSWLSEVAWHQLSGQAWLGGAKRVHIDLLGPHRQSQYLKIKQLDALRHQLRVIQIQIASVQPNECSILKRLTNGMNLQSQADY